MKDLEQKLVWLPLPVRRAIDVVRWWRLRLRREHGYFERACRQEFFRRAFVALSFNKIDGDYAEFGCHGGMTFSLAYHESRTRHPCRFWGFDSFCGLPARKAPQDDHPQWIEGAMCTGLDEFHTICRYHGIPRSAYKVVPGYYDVTLADQALDIELPTNICLAYIDCDLYSSTLAVLNFLLPRLKHGMILAFDDYYCWSSTQISGERRACVDIFADSENWRLVPYMQFGWHGMSFVIESNWLSSAVSATY